VIHAAERWGVRALGVTLSEQQHELARSRIADAGLEDRVEVRCVDYRDVREEPFDKLVSVGMFEHVGRERLPGYFAHAFGALKPGGLFLNHGIAGKPRTEGPLEAEVRRRLEPRLVGGSTFRRRYVFPSGGLVPVSEANLVAERAGFEVRDVENLREHYALTLRHWARRLEENRDEAIRLGGRTMYRLWRLYMGMGSWQFEDGEFRLCQSLLEKPAGGPSRLPPTRADLYAPRGEGGDKVTG
jgi:cyclopropane-fatty-acyl-phospholipid synthase